MGIWGQKNKMKGEAVESEWPFLPGCPRGYQICHRRNPSLASSTETPLSSPPGLSPCPVSLPFSFRLKNECAVLEFPHSEDQG